MKQVQSEEKIREEKNLFKYSSRNFRHGSIHRVLRNIETYRRSCPDSIDSGHVDVSLQLIPSFIV